MTAAARLTPEQLRLHLAAIKRTRQAARQQKGMTPCKS